MDRLINIGEAAKRLGVSISTLRRWEAQGRLVPERTPAGHRRYDVCKLAELTGERFASKEQRKTIAYARVSSNDQKADLERQRQVLERFCAQKGWEHEIICDLGSGMNCRKKGLVKLLELLVSGRMKRLVLTRKDQLLRFGAELVFSICELKNVEVVIINQGEEPSFEEDLEKDVLEILTVFSARLYGSRSSRSQKLIEGMKQAVSELEKRA